VDGQQDHAQIVEIVQKAKERRLVLHDAHNVRFPVRAMRDHQMLKAVETAWGKMALNPDLVS
jgi:hypothetical protein